MTRNQKKATLRHVLRNVLDLDENNTFIAALASNGYDTLQDAMSIREGDYIKLDYLTEGDNPVTRLPDESDFKKWMAFQSYVIHKQRIGEPIQPADFVKVTNKEFDDYRVSGDFIAFNAGITPPSHLQSKSSVSTAKDPSVSFQKSIKRDVSLYPILKEDKQYDNWNRGTIALARTHDVEEVFDEKYTPTALDDVALFAAKQKFVYAVFEKGLQTDIGKQAVRDNFDDGDAQKVYATIKKHYNESVKATLDSSKLVKYVSTARLTPSTWKGTYAGFISHWKEQVRLYHSLTKKGKHITDQLLHTLLQNAVQDVSDLRRVAIDAEHHKVQHGKDMTYHEYVELVTSAALSLDETQDRITDGIRQNAKRKVYQHDVLDTIGETYYDADEYFDIDTSLQTVQAFAANNMPNVARVPPDMWKSLSPEGRSWWAKLPHDDRKVLMRQQPSSSSTASTMESTISTRPPGRAPGSIPPSRTRSVNVNDVSSTTPVSFNDISLGAFIAELQSMTASTDEPNDPEPDTSNDNATNDGLMAFVSNQKRAPSDIHRILSKAAGRTANKNGSPNDGSSTTGARKAFACDVIYQSSEHRTMKKSALADRGCNGHMFGIRDVRIISRSNRRVDAEGIDHHRMNDLRIGTAGGVTPTQKGPVIAIFNQGACTQQDRTILSSGQMEHFGIKVDDRSSKVGGTQTITTPEGYVIPLDIKSGLPYMSLRPYTDDEWDTLPHVIMSSDLDWDPSVLDSNIIDDEQWYDAVSDFPEGTRDPKFDTFDLNGDYRLVSFTDVWDNHLPDIDLATMPFDRIIDAHVRNVTSKDPPYETLRPNFGYLPTDIIRRTFDCTTQYARVPNSDVLKKAYKSPFPAANVH